MKNQNNQIYKLWFFQATEAPVIQFSKFNNFIWLQLIIMQKPFQFCIPALKTIQPVMPYCKYLSLYGIYKSKEWWQMKFLKTEIQYAFFSNTMKVRKKLHHTHNWTSVDLKVSDQSNIFHILSLTEPEQGSNNKSVCRNWGWWLLSQWQNI